MPLNLTVDQNYAWVILAGVSTGWLTLWQGVNVSRHRKAAKVAYPQLYAEKKEAEASVEALKFNCAQRAHQNTLEYLPQTLFALAFAGIKYPIIAASLGGIHLVGRVFYTLGYSTGDPKKRYFGEFGVLAQLGLQLLATYQAGQLVFSTFCPYNIC